MRRLSRFLVIAASSGAIVTLATGVASGAPNRSYASAGRTPGASHGLLIPVGPLRRTGTMKSENWSGYAVTTTKVTSVQSTFDVPTASTPPTGYAATWTGIGGYGTRDLIQAGVAESDPSGTAQYYPWYELLPAGETRINKPVSPGDQVTVTITESTSNSKQWTISLSDPHSGWTFTKTVKYKSRRESAEWILEAPTVDGGQTRLPSLSTAYFGPTSTYSVNHGSVKTISAGNPIKILLVKSNGSREATPSSLESGQEFNDCAHASTCLAP